MPEGALHYVEVTISVLGADEGIALKADAEHLEVPVAERAVRGSHLGFIPLPINSSGLQTHSNLPSSWQSMSGVTVSYTRVWCLGSRLVRLLPLKARSQRHRLVRIVHNITNRC